jgi:hypothetical protein
MKNFENQFAKQRKLSNVFFVFNRLIIIASIFGIVVLGYTVLTNPEIVGEFFGRILKGFESVK